jgi:L-alanine-DL-glutamate epimerase-like enolase superfamily enzyme
VTHLPAADVLLARAHVVSIPMRVRFRGLDTREAMLFEGPSGWGEFAPFVEYDDVEAAKWLAAGIEAAWGTWPEPVRGEVPVNATVPAVGPDRVPEVLARFPGCRTAKVKVAPLGGVARALEVVDACGLPAVVSSALDTSVGISAGVALAAALPDLDHACGLGTVGLFVEDVARAPLRPVDGVLRPGRAEPDVELLGRLAARPDRTRWWRDRVERCLAVLERPGGSS